MYRQNYTPNQILPMWKLVLILVILIGVMFYFTQNDHGDEQAIAVDLDQAQRDAQAQARFEKAAQAMCGDNAAWTDLGNGSVQCFTKRGKKTTVAEVK